LGKGAKSTRGFKWKIIYKKKFNLKCEAMSYEYKLKKDRLRRSIFLNNSNV
jgi:putative endonuclease